MIQCARQIYITNGLAGFWIGFLPCLIGVLPGNAALFFTYAVVMRYLTRGEKKEEGEEI
jgi:hypothetical protein